MILAPKEIDYWVKDEEPRPQAVPLKGKAGGGASRPVVEPEDPPFGTSGRMSFLDGLRRSLFGKPELANAPPEKERPKLARKTPNTVDTATSPANGGTL